VTALLITAGSVGAVFLYGESLESGKIDAVRARMKVIAIACEEYRLSHNVWPRRLEMLIEGDPARGGSPYFADMAPLIDPWGKVYGYDPDDPQGPLLFCTTPRGQLLTHRVASGQP
jgi:hypothetical protein